ncbi:hypothetical protein COCSUDRAFT_63401 [Coccomyxa subellipsoidea C-169]|uniref:Uncharacterized protein n=1 Tax=Coccomyxa subellipsoidea (strain C-169) TaxID=574566 RepID=I0YX97_COCSC|nr:hypothetical protein COCSUDRAFT_63401 [Coccomyxa subellipsoidea C-169]EIE23016.1 hypothetical protein COCSUDRAFT_63401 [Coccomyxa subellipsoidea C-169]|eukprot:XP_005647560.1 hypothetical protein COCSUDRAFT_63401 [Coccomyxa subellipsoidea C-169]
MGGSISPRPRQQEADEFSRCNTPQQPVPGFACGLESLMQAAWQVPFPKSSLLGRSPRAAGACAADSSHSDGSNAVLRDFGLNGAESPPWSPRRVPPAHVWGEGPPRAPGYRSGGACYPIASPGVSAANLVEAACELHALLQRRSAAGLGPLIGAQGYLTPPADPGIYPDKEEATPPPQPDPAAVGNLPPIHLLTASHTPSPGPGRCPAATLPPPEGATAPALLNSPQGVKRQAAWQCGNDSQLSFGDRIDAATADEVSSPHALSSAHQRWGSAPPVHELRCCANLADDSTSAGQHAASALPDDRPTRAALAAAGACFGGGGAGACFGDKAAGACFGGDAKNGAGLGRAPSVPEIGSCRQGRPAVLKWRMQIWPHKARQQKLARKSAVRLQTSEGLAGEPSGGSSEAAPNFSRLCCPAPRQHGPKRRPNMAL